MTMQLATRYCWRCWRHSAAWLQGLRNLRHRHAQFLPVQVRTTRHVAKSPGYHCTGLAGQTWAMGLMTPRSRVLPERVMSTRARGDTRYRTTRHVAKSPGYHCTGLAGQTWAMGLMTPRSRVLPERVMSTRARGDTRHESVQALWV